MFSLIQIQNEKKKKNVHYDFLKLHYIINKDVNPLAMGVFTCNSNVTNVTLKTIK